MSQNEEDVGNASVGEVLEEAEEDVQGVLNGGGEGSFQPLGSYGGGGSASYFRSLLLGMWINPAPYRNLINQAASEGWSADEFMWSLANTNAFQNTFPGINHLLQKGMSLGTAVSTWRGMAEQYREIAKQMHLGNLARLTPQRIGTLIRGDVDMEEFVVRLRLYDIATRTDYAREQFNRILSKFGRAKLDRVGWYRFIMGHGEEHLYNIYEANVLLNDLGPEGLKVAEAKRLAKVVGSFDNPADLSQVLSQVEKIHDALGTQVLKEAGIQTADLALGVLRDQVGGQVARKADLILRDVEQMLLNREAMNKAIDKTSTIVRGGRPISEAAPQGELAG